MSTVTSRVSPARVTGLIALGLIAVWAGFGCSDDVCPELPPQIAAVSAVPREVAPGEEAELRVTLAHSAGRPLVIDWEATGGSFPHGTSWEEVIWAAPGSSCVCTVTVTARDDRGMASADLLIPVTINRPLLQLEPHALDFGIDLTTGRLLIANAGGRTLGWELLATPAWVTFSQYSGMIRALGPPDTVTAEASRDGLPPGTYQDTLALSSNGGTLAVPVSMTIPPTPVWSYVIVDSFPHDREAFTQGLGFADGVLYEGTGRYGKSRLREVELETGDVLREHSIPRTYYGEGIAVADTLVFQLTLNAGRAYVYRRADFEVLRTESYSTVGWGLAFDGERLILSAGNSWLYFHDLETFDSLGQVEVRDQGVPVDDLNELEYVGGLVYANILHSDRIACIDPGSGLVVRWIDLTGLSELADYGDPISDLNGIAHDAAGDRLFVTGKLWPVLFEITPVPPE